MTMMTDFNLGGMEMAEIMDNQTGAPEEITKKM